LLLASYYVATSVPTVTSRSYIFTMLYTCIVTLLWRHTVYGKQGMSRKTLLIASKVPTITKPHSHTA
jgi:hypothetical protein